MEHTVSFEINVDADTPQEACRRAWRLLSSQESMRPVGTVTDPSGNQTQVDLEQENPFL